jgi:hypothetical protein
MALGLTSRSDIMAAGSTAGSNSDPLQDRARNASRELKDTAKETARGVLGEQQHAAASSLGQFAAALRKAAHETGDGQQGQIARVAETAADGLDRLSASLRERNFDRLVGDLESFARRQPVVFFGAALATGFLAMRFLKASNRPVPQTGSPARDAGNATGNLPY